MTTAAATTAATAGSPAQTPSKAENPGGQLGKNDFLKLMVAQLQAQNPLEPSDGTQYIAELAQFSQLEQTTNIAQSSSSAASAQQVGQAVQLIGHTVSYVEAATGKTVEGKVQSVEIGSTGASLTVEGVRGIAPSEVTEVA